MIRRAQDYLGILTIASTALQRLPLASPDLIPSPYPNPDNNPVHCCCSVQRHTYCHCHCDCQDAHAGLHPADGVTLH